MIKTRSGREQALAEREQLFIEATRQQLCNEGLLGIQMAAIARWFVPYGPLVCHLTAAVGHTGGGVARDLRANRQANMQSDTIPRTKIRNGSEKPPL